MTEEAAQAAQTALIEARSNLMLRNQVIETAMTANPILKAVHNSTNASPVERYVCGTNQVNIANSHRDLLSYVERRDEGSIAVAKHAAKMGRVREELNMVQSETFKVSRQNVQLTSELLSLVEEMRQLKPSKSSDPKMQDKIKQSELELASSRQRWKVVKAVASGVVVGSGINWASERELEDVVLYPEDEDAENVI